MSGPDYKQKDIDDLINEFLAASKDHREIKAEFKPVDGGPKVRIFATGIKKNEYAYDRVAKRVYRKLFDGKPRWILSKENPAHQREALEYVLQQLVLRPRLLEDLWKLRGKDTKRGQADYKKILRGILHKAFEMCDVSNFISAE